ncbi:hypothetical protein CBS147345_9936 [Aspergillus niger]|nr:hypothetical protein CBS147345_9936 [Aspergillus niger]
MLHSRPPATRTTRQRTSGRADKRFQPIIPKLTPTYNTTNTFPHPHPTITTPPSNIYVYVPQTTTQTLPLQP